MKSQVQLLVAILQEEAANCGTDPTKDVRYVLGRIAEEGESFLTITLPAFERGLLAALELGHADPNLWPGFRQRRGLPMFLSGFLRIIFSENGDIRPIDRPSLPGEIPLQVRAIRSIRQITLAMSKLFVVCSDKRVADAMRDYVQVDDEIPDLSEHKLKQFEATFLRYFGYFFQDLENSLFNDGITPAHGPGAVANRLGNNARWSCNIWTERLESVLPAYEGLSVSLHDFLDNEFVYLTEEEEPPVRVVPVPKTMKTPRIIAIEPSWNMYVQQGLLRRMTELLQERSHREVNSSVGWLSQEPNRKLASDWSSFGTIDLSAASDRVPLALVNRMLGRFPFTRDLILASRSTTALLPDGSVKTLRKFASMGSAVCFPIETFVFATCALMGMAKAGSKSLYGGDAYRWPTFRVYGDDIIVPLDTVPSVLQVLESFGFKVNRNKSFWKGLFRESCGAEWYAGYDVSVVKVRAPLPESRHHAWEVMKAVDLHNRLYERCLYESAQLVEARLCKLGFGYYAPSGQLSMAMWTEDDDPRVKRRFNKRLFRLEVKTLIPRPILPKDSLDGYGALRKTLRKPEEALPYSEDHLERAGRSRRVAINVGWSALA